MSNHRIDFWKKLTPANEPRSESSDFMVLASRNPADWRETGEVLAEWIEAQLRRGFVFEWDTDAVESGELFTIMAGPPSKPEEPPYVPLDDVWPQDELVHLRQVEDLVHQIDLTFIPEQGWTAKTLGPDAGPVYAATLADAVKAIAEQLG